MLVEDQIIPYIRKKSITEKCFNGEILLLDEDELKEAFDRFEVSKDDFENAYKEAYNLIERLSNNKDKLVEFTNKFL